jgi:hypothetical protein
MTQFFDYDATNPFSLMDTSAIRPIIEALTLHYKEQDADPHTLVLIEYAQEEYNRQQAMDDPPEAKIGKKLDAALGIHPSGDATTPDEYWAKAPSSDQ